MNTEELRKLASESDKAHWFPGAAYLNAFNPKTAIALLDRLAALEAENAELRAIVSGCVAALGTTAGCSPECSMEFMKGVPDEIAGTVLELRKRRTLTDEQIDDLQWPHQNTKDGFQWLAFARSVEAALKETP